MTEVSNSRQMHVQMLLEIIRVVKARTRKVSIIFFIPVLASLLFPNFAVAHGFNVGLIVPSSVSMPGASLQILNGFKIAALERDSHPDQESDGHLGGLDVYLTLIDEHNTFTGGIEQHIPLEDIDIVAAVVSNDTRLMLEGLQLGKSTALLFPGAVPSLNSNQPGVKAFVAVYKQKHGTGPSPLSAYGYDLARRIDSAVRSQGGVKDISRLRQDFAESDMKYVWHN